jgi:tetratricopeptide (TPR) repeat protein
LAIVGSLALVAAFSYALLDLNHSRVADRYQREAQALAAPMEQDNWRGSNRAYAKLLEAQEAAVNADPENAALHYELNSYRWHSISRVIDPNTGGIVMTQQTKESARKIVDELHRDRSLCPTYGLPLSLAGQIEAFVFDDLSTGAKHARLGRKLTPNHFVACYSAGLMSALEGKWDESVQNLQKCVRLNPGMFDDVVNFCLNRLNRPQLALDFAAGNADWLLMVSDRLKEPQYADYRARARKGAMELLKQECDQPHPPSAKAATLAGLCQEYQDYDNAIEYYRQALDGDYGQVTWRLGLAQCLARTGRNSEAVHEATICLRLEPQTPAARTLIEELSVKPASQR